VTATFGLIVADVFSLHSRLEATAKTACSAHIAHSISSYVAVVVSSAFVGFSLGNGPAKERSTRSARLNAKVEAVARLATNAAFSSLSGGIMSSVGIRL
jgi:hypothetical protein